MNRPWLRMQKCLPDHPKVVLISEQTNTHVAHVVGGLLIIWGVADNNDGRLPYWTPENVDRATGISGMGDALVHIGWLSDGHSGLLVKDYEQWMGGKVHAKDQAATRKARQRDAERTKSVTSSVTPVTPNVTAGSRPSNVTSMGQGAGHPSPSPSPSPSRKQQSEEKKKDEINRMKAAARRREDPEVQALLEWVSRKGVNRWFMSTFDDKLKIRLANQDRGIADVEAYIQRAAVRGHGKREVMQLLGEVEQRRNQVQKPPQYVLAKLRERIPDGIGAPCS